MFTRREILRSFLGLPLALAACRSGPDIVSYDGEIVGANADIGHILRDRRLFEVARDNWEKTEVVIVGGGVAGLSAARALDEAGYGEFILLELEKRIGGTSASGSSNIVSYPWGAHYLPIPFKENTGLVALLREMDLAEGFDEEGEIQIKEQYLIREPEERVFYKGRWYEGLYLHAGESAEDVRQLKEFQRQIDFWVDWRDARGRRAFVLPVAACSRDAEVIRLDQISFADWLREKGLNSERLVWYCDYACRDDYGLRLEDTSAWAGLFYFCSRVPRAGAESQSFVTFPEGNGRFVDYLFDQVRQRVRRSQLAVEMIPREKGVDVICYNAETREIHGIRARKAIFAAPIFTAGYLIRDFRADPPGHIGEFRHNAWFVANLFLRDRPRPQTSREFPLAWDNVLYDSPSLGYVVATHQPGIDYGASVFTYYYPMAAPDGRAKLLGLDWRELSDICLTDLERAHPDIRSLTKRIDIMRWGHAMISPRTGFLWSGAREKAQQPYRNIHFAHSDLSGVALFEEAFYHGQRAAKEIVDKL